MRIFILCMCALVMAACGSSETATTAVNSSSDVAPPAATVPPPTRLDPAEERTTPEGMKMIIHARGNGEAATPGAVTRVHYTGWLLDESAPDGKGAKFDSSVDRGQPFQFPLGQGRVIKGWDTGVADMRVGGKRTLIIPPHLAYGPAGRPPIIPQNATLVFDVELLGVN